MVRAYKTMTTANKQERYMTLLVVSQERENGDNNRSEKAKNGEAMRHDRGGAQGSAKEQK